MINKCPVECVDCKYGEFYDLPSSWKCKNCGKNHGKIRILNISGIVPEGKDWITKKTADVVEYVRPDLKTAKIIDRKRKKSYTERLEDDGTSKIIQERDL